MRRTKKIVVIGANGQLGADLISVLSKNKRWEIIGLNHKDFDITSENFSLLGEIDPAHIINTAAFHNLDKVEKNPKKGFLINSLGPFRLASYCKAHKCQLTHISTDYVFGNDLKHNEPYLETDVPSPINMYGITKIAGEYAIRSILPNALIVRVAGLYGQVPPSGKKSNFVDLMLSLAERGKPIRVVDDQITSPTYTSAVAKNLMLLIDHNVSGLFHMTSQGSCSWYDFAKQIFQISQKKVSLTKILSSEVVSLAKRPKYSVLQNAELKKIDLDIMPSWEDSLREYLMGKGYL